MQIGKEKGKLSLFTDNLIVCIKPQGIYHNLLELINSVRLQDMGRHTKSSCISVYQG